MSWQGEPANNSRFSRLSALTELWTKDQKDLDYKDLVFKLQETFENLSKMANNIVNERYFNPIGDDKYLRQDFAELLRNLIKPIQQTIDLSADYYVSKTIFKKNCISVEEFNEILLKGEEILLIDYRKTRSDQLSFEGMDNILVVELDTCWLTEDFNFNLIKVKISNFKDRQMLVWKKFFHIVIVDEDDGHPLRKDILMKGLEETKRLIPKDLNIVSLEGGFEKFRELNLDNVKPIEEPYKEKTLNRILLFSKGVKNVKLTINRETTMRNQQIYNESNNKIVSVKRKLNGTTPFVGKKILRKSQELLYDNNSIRGEAKENKPQSPSDNDVEKINSGLTNNDIGTKQKYPYPKLFSDKFNTPFRSVYGNTMKKRIHLNDDNEEMYQSALKAFGSISIVGYNMSGMTGFKNIGNTCYMNAILQILLHLPELKTLFEYESVVNILKTNGINASQGRMALVFSALMDVFWSNKYVVINPRHFLDTFSKMVNPGFNDGRQHDAQEFQMYLLNGLHKVTSFCVTQENFEQNYNGENIVEEFNDFKRRNEQSSNSKIKSLFYLGTASTLKCSTCNYQSITFERSSQISVELVDDSLQETSLSKCLENYCTKEILDDGWKCPKCDVKRQAFRTQRIMELPKILIIHKKRFVFDNGECQKKETYVSYKLGDFDMSPYMHEEVNTGNKFLYELFGIVCHKGEYLTRGHYTAYIKVNGAWIHYDDVDVKHIHENETLIFQKKKLFNSSNLTTKIFNSIISVQMGKIFLYLLFSFLLAITKCIRLNVPRILLPYHPEVQAVFLLSVSYPEGHCFKWRSTRNEIVSVEPIFDASGCSISAKIISRSHYQAKQTAIVFAENSEANILLNCDVAVDTVDKIFITTNAKLLYIEASPSQVYVEAENKEGERFSSLSNIPFDWSINSADGRPLRIIPYSRSKYDAPVGISDLEQKKKKGYVILVEGLSTGTASLDVKFEDKNFNYIAPASITFNVVANLLLIPSNDLYMTVNSQIEYKAGIVKQQGMEKIDLPSEQYYLKLNDESVVKLKEGTSKVIAKKLGQCEITLIDSFLKHEGESIKRESAHIYVVQPDSIIFTNNKNNDNWYAQLGDIIEISIGLTDASGNHIVITNEMQFKTIFKNEYFQIISMSKNETYAVVKMLKLGEVTIRSSYESIKNAETEETFNVIPVIKGSQKIHIVDKVAVIPTKVIVPYLPTMRPIYQLKAIGGSGNYIWNSNNLNVAKIGLNDGTLSVSDYGVSKINVYDMNDKSNNDEALLNVLKPNTLEFGESFVEAEVNTDLILPIKLSHERDDGEKIYFTDCSSVPFTLSVSDTNIFKIVESTKSENSIGCHHITLRAMTIGDTKVSVFFNGLSTTKEISSYFSVKPVKKQILLALGSYYPLEFSDGPRPWIGDQSQFFTDVLSTDDNVFVKKIGNKFNVYCGDSVSSTMIRINVGNRKSESNPMPKISSTTMNVCCSIPKKLDVTINDNVQRSSRNFLPSCPKQILSIHSDAKNDLVALAYGNCIDSKDNIEKMFDSSDSMNIKWSSSNYKLLDIKSAKGESTTATVSPKSIPGQVDITASISSFKNIFKNNEKILISHNVYSTVTLNIVDFVKASPEKLFLWSEVDNKGIINLVGGSGHFHLSKEKVPNVFAKLISSDFKIEVSPEKIGSYVITVYDICIPGSKVDINIKISDVSKLIVNSLESVEIGSEIPLKVSLLSSDNEEFDNVNVSQMNVKLTESNNFGRLNTIGYNKYTITGVKYGIYTVTASTRTTKNKVLTSDPHNIQIFAPIELSPKVVTLVSESYFQFDFIGGPTPLPEIKFDLSNPNVATVDSNGLIFSKKQLGLTNVKAISLNNQFKSSMQEVIIKVVTLEGIKIKLSTNTPFVGEIVTATIYGLNEDESPFSFGGAIYPLTVEWKFSKNQNIELLTSYGENPDDILTNKFSIKFKVFKEGEIIINALVTKNQNSYKHFPSSTNEFKASTRLEVHENIKLVPSIVSTDAILISPKASFKLKTNKDVSQIKYSTPLHTNYVTFIQPDIIKASDNVGTVVLKIEYNSPMKTKVVYENIDIGAPSSIAISIESPFYNNIVNQELKIPQGARLKLNVKYLDANGRVFSAHNGKAVIRPNRFDFIQILDKNDLMFDVRLIKAGETIINVHDDQVPSITDYVKIVTFDIILPVARKFTSNDIVCFSTPMEYMLNNNYIYNWKSDNENVAFYDGTSKNIGRFIMKNKGYANIFANIPPENVSTFTSIEVNEAESITYISTPNYISNFNGARYIVNFVFTSENSPRNTNTHSCTISDLKSMKKIVPTYYCQIRFTKPQSSNVPISELFSVNSIFDTDTGFYACEILHKNGSTNTNDVHFDRNQKIEISVLDFSKNYKKNTISTSFMPKFEVYQSSFTFNNGPQSSNVLSIYGPKEAAKHIKINYCNSVSFIISPISNIQYSKYGSTPGNLFYEIEFNGLSGNINDEGLKDCFISVTNEETFQTIKIPVTINYDGKYSYVTEKKKFFLLDNKTIFLIGFTAFIACAFVLFYKWIVGSPEYVPVYMDGSYRGNISQGDNSQRAERQSYPSEINNETAGSLGISPLRTSTPSVVRKPRIYESIYKIGRPSFIPKGRESSSQFKI